jgi:parvulin-like peptidyl-prolyl isomerase
MKDRQISDEERTQAREFYAKIHIYDQEYKDKVASGQISKEAQDKVNLQIKLQQAQFLARLYSEKLVEKAKVTDEDVDKYIAEHPELDPKEKRNKAQEILNRAKNGEDFAALANEFSEDPGNKSGDKGEPQGGLYKEVTKGQMVPAFEKAALSLEPGQVAPELVETDYGFHIIKLERKGPTKGEDGKEEETYDARHILISTGYKDPENPMGREMPVKMYVRQKLETEKEKKVLDDIIAANHIEVPEDFSVPEVTDEQIQEMMKNRQQPQMDLGEDGEEPPPPPSKKPAPKKGK